ncbi:MAG: TolC family protein [Kofleriaceae bacterium]
MLAPVPPPSQSFASWRQARERLAAASTDLRQAEANVARAAALARQALAALLPDARLTIGAAYDLDNPESPPGAPASVDGRRVTTPVATASLSVSQRVVDLAAHRGRAAARSAARASGWSLLEQRRRLQQGLARTLVAVVAAERIAELVRVGLRQALERAALSQRTFELGRATELDVLRARQDVALARSAVIAGDEQLRVARESLGLAVGVEEQVGVTPELRLDELLVELQAQCRPLAPGERRADAEAAAAAVDAARQRTAQARASKLPTLFASSSLFALTTDPGAARVASWSIGAVLSVPLWEGGLRAAQVREREALERDAEAVAEELRRATGVEVARARRAQVVAESLVTVATEALELATRLDAMTRRSFEIGRATSLELVQSAVALRQAELTLALRQFEWTQARLDAHLTAARCDP